MGSHVPHHKELNFAKPHELIKRLSNSRLKHNLANTYVFVLREPEQSTSWLWEFLIWEMSEWFFFFKATKFVVTFLFSNVRQIQTLRSFLKGPFVYPKPGLNAQPLLTYNYHLNIIIRYSSLFLTHSKKKKKWTVP